MKSYTITVNGNVYDVTVEETGAAAPAAAPWSPGRSPTPAPRLTPAYLPRKDSASDPPASALRPHLGNTAGLPRFPPHLPWGQTGCRGSGTPDGCGSPDCCPLP